MMEHYLAPTSSQPHRHQGVLARGHLVWMPVTGVVETGTAVNWSYKMSVETEEEVEIHSLAVVLRPGSSK